MCADTVKVLSVRRERVFKTPFEAINYANSRQERVSAANGKLKGTKVESVNWSDTSCALRFSNGFFLTVKVGKNGVLWGVRKSMMSGPASPSPRVLDLIFVGGNEDLEEKWQRADIVEHCVGRSFKMIRSGDNLLYVYLQGMDILAFDSLRKIANREPFLYWFLTP